MGRKPDSNGWFPIDTIPKDGTPVLVWLPEPSLGCHIHGARCRENGFVIGHHFVYDTGKPTHWRPALDPPNPALARKEPVRNPVDSKDTE